ncbi:MAG: EAL domain-containing protein [Devosia sp.]|nr:EAL domain-containing protein [Devosia sp.]
MNFASIRTRLALYALIYVVLLVGLCGIAFNRIVAMHNAAQEVAGPRLGATQLLGELGNQVVEFRLAETYRALTQDPTKLPAVDQEAESHRHAISALLTEYVGLLGDVAATDKGLASLRQSLADYLKAHDAWVLSDPGGTDHAPAYSGSSLHELAKTVEDNIDGLLQANIATATLDAAAASQLGADTITVMIVLSISAMAIGVLLLFRTFANVTRPLAEITNALTRLAAGHRDVVVPLTDRHDEIGQMAKAFDVFRANAAALEQAQAATQAAQEQAQALARHDALTGLPNRRVFSAELQTALAHVQAGSGNCSVFSVDLDRFKQVNDLQGHPVGDLVLCEVALRLRKAVRDGDTVARLGGDEFAIITPTGTQGHPELEIRLAQRLIDLLCAPMQFGATQVEIGASVGIASAPANGTDADDLLRAADIALYRAKNDGRSTFRFFEQSMDQELRAQAALEADLRRAVSEGAIKAHYQPLVDINENRIYGFEVLARWEHPERGWVPPATFIPLAERLGLMAALTASLLHQACRDALQWDASIILSVNISAVQLRDAALPTQLLTILNEEGFPPSRLEIEITETALVSDLETARQVLSALQSIGIKVSLDDFGTGYSSLYHLREIKFDKVKIDRSFVESMEENSESLKIVDSILSLAKSIGLPAVAEGIENQQVLQRLTDRGCEFGQGYLFGKAMTAEKATEALAGADPLRKAG